MNKVIVFDMDGTIADLYGVKGWLEDLRNENIRPYAEAAPMWDMVVLGNVLRQLQAEGWKVVITTWTAKDGSKEYNRATAKVKKAWLDYFNFPYDAFHAVKYGTTKLNCTRRLGGYQILVDDNDKVRKGWKGGETVNPVETDIIEFFTKKLLTA